jgi:hypothetical protein
MRRGSWAPDPRVGVVVGSSILPPLRLNGGSVRQGGLELARPGNGILGESDGSIVIPRLLGIVVEVVPVGGLR